jgi:hypothetical protein
MRDPLIFRKCGICSKFLKFYRHIVMTLSNRITALQYSHDDKFFLVEYLPIIVIYCHDLKHYFLYLQKTAQL